MTKVTINAIIGGMGFYALWIMLAVMLSENTLYQLLLGAFAALVFGVGFYLFGRYFNQNQADQL